MQMQKTNLIILFFLTFLISSCNIFKHSDNTVRNVSEKDNVREFNFAFIEAEKQKMLGNFDDASMLYEKCKSLDPKSAVIYYELATLYIQKELFNKAIEEAKTAIKLNPQNSWYKALLAVLYKQTNNPNDAISVYKELTRDNFERIDFLYDLANLYSDVKKYDDAIKTYNLIESNYGLNETISLEKERIYYLTGDKNKANNEIQKLIKSNPAEIRYLGMLAESYVNENEFEKAKETYQQMLSVDSANGLVHLSLADFYRITKDYDKSFLELKTAFASQEVEIDVKIKMLISFLSYSSESTELKNQSYDLLNILLKTHPDDPKTHTLYADFLIRDKKNQDAREQLRLVIKTEKSKYLIWEQLLLLESELQDFPNMYSESDEALQYFPNQPILYYFKGLSSIQLKKPEEAIPLLNTGIGLVTDNPSLKADMYSLLGDAYHKTGNTKESDSAMEQVLKLDKGNKIVLNNYSYYLSLRGDSLDKAERMSLVCVELDPLNSTYIDTYAWVLFKQKKFEKALVEIEKAYNNGGNRSAVIVEHYGDILYKLGQTERAIEKWNEAIKIGKGSEFLEKKVTQKILIE
jgi:tetratricopeptide (TPR) repeat protein